MHLQRVGQKHGCTTGTNLTAAKMQKLKRKKERRKDVLGSYLSLTQVCYLPCLFQLWLQRHPFSAEDWSNLTGTRKKNNSVKIFFFSTHQRLLNFLSLFYNGNMVKVVEGVSTNRWDWLRKKSCVLPSRHFSQLQIRCHDTERVNEHI